MKHPLIKALLAHVGEHLSPEAIHRCNGFYNYLHAGFWLKENGFRRCPRYSSRVELYAAIARTLKEPLDFLEFGVFRGESIAAWARLLRDPETRLVGFDSFQGLPEKWRMAADRSTFDVGGAIPQIDDSRVRFVKGWFSESVPVFLQHFRGDRDLILHLDADLYSSTIYVLNELRRYMNPSTVLVFDEFFDRDHELRAFDEFRTGSGLSFECVGVTRALVQVAFRVR